MDGWVTIGAKLDTKDFDAQIKDVESKLNDVEATLKMASKDKTLFSTREIKEMEVEAEKLKNKLIDLRKKQSDLNKGDLSGISSSMSNILKKVTKWGLAIFSVRSAYMLIRQSMSTLSQYNEDMANKIETIRLALATALEPIVTRIVDWVYKLIGYMNILTKAWFGIDLFAHAQEKSLKNSVGAAKELRKQLAGFDEMNVLNENGTTGLAGATNTIFNPPELDDSLVRKFEKFAQVLKDNLWWIQEVGKALGIIFGAYEIGKLIKNIGALMGAGGVGGLTTALNSIPTSIKIGIVLAGVSYVIDTINKMKSDVKQLNEDMDKLRNNGKKTYKEQWEGENDVNKLLEEQKRQRDLIVERVGDHYNILHKIVGLDEIDLKNAKESAELNKIILDKLWEQYDLGNMDKKQKQELLQTLIDNYNYNLFLLKTLEAEGIETGNLGDITEDYGKKIGQVAEGLGISQDKLNGMIKKSAEEDVLTQNIYKNIKDINNTKLNDKKATYTIIAEADTSKAKSVFSSLFDVISTSFKKIFGFASGGITYGFAKGGITVPKPVYCAQGSIISQPGRGVPISQAIGGEAGREGIIPLTNQQAMEELGTIIGRNVILNLTNITKLDNRQIAREQKIINAQNDFAYNR